MRCFCTKTRTYHCKVVLLDDQELLQEIQSTSTGQDVLDTVFRHLNLIETSYFGLRYVDCNNQTHWLDTTKKITKQLKGKDSFTLYFGVKFYAADPCKLVEEITRYQFFLQVKQDILQGRLPVSFDLLAELGAYAVQSELGDYDPRRHSPGYVSEFRFISNQTVELENKIAELHKGLQGQLPAVAELNYLDKVKWLEMYGVDLHPVIGEDNVEYFLGLTPVGVIVLRNKSKVANYYWSRIKKIYFKGKYFMLRVSDKNNEENTYGFETPSRAACKHLYKCCKEHHSFFQLVHVSTNAPDVINTRFSSSRVDKLSGRSSQMGMRNPPSFIRTPSRRYQRRIVEGAAETPKIEEKMPVKENPTNDESKSVYVASSTTNSFYINRSDSPRSTRSAPWSVWGSTGPPRNSYSSHSPRSVRSAGPQVRLTHAKRSSSVESQSSNDSRPCRRHKHKSKRGSDNESDLSRCSSHGHSHRRHRHRSRRSSGSEQEHHSHHGSHTRYKLIDSEGQWKEVQRRQAEGNSGIQEATVVRPRSGYVNSGIETESEHSSCHHHRRKHRKHRSRSRSPEGSKSHLPDELKKHLEFQLVDTEGMSEDQLREIPYTVVKTNASKAVRVRLSSSGKPKVHSIRRTKNDVIKENVSGCNEDSPPPPYSESPILSDLSSKTTSTSTTAGTGTSDGSKQISAAHLTRVSSHMMRSNGNNVNPKTACSALYGNPSNLLGHPHYNMAASNSNKDVPNGNNSWMSNNSNFPVNSLVVGLPPQPHSRRPYSNSHSDLSLNTSTRSLNSQKGWPSPEIRGAVGIPWSPLAEQIQSPSVNSLYSTLENTRRAPILSADYNNINQNILEHRSINGNAFRSNTKASPQVSTSNVNQNAKMAAENEKVRKHHTPAETGVLRSYTNTPNGKMAWPNERQLGWQPKSNEKNASNLNHNWSGNGNWNNDDYSQQWNNAGTPMVGNAVPQSWQIPQQLPQPPVNFRGVDRGPLLFAPQSQMHRINENVSAEAAESKNFINFVNNNQSNSPNSPNNNMSTQHSITSDVNGRICSQINTERNTENCTRSNENLDTTCNTNNINDSNNNDRNPNNQDSIKQFIQEMSTEL